MATTRYNALIQERADLRRRAEENLRECEAAGRVDLKHQKIDDALNAQIAALQAEIYKEEVLREEGAGVRTAMSALRAWDRRPGRPVRASTSCSPEWAATPAGSARCASS